MASRDHYVSRFFFPSLSIPTHITMPSRGFGLPTRLLDWTENFACALYFAQLNRARSDDAATFILSPQKLNKTTIGREGLVALGGETSIATNVNIHSYHPGLDNSGNDMETLAVVPVLTNSRMVAQRSAFTLSGASFQPLEQRYPQCIEKIVLPVSIFDEPEQFLELIGQGHFGLFPDLEGLREELIATMDREVSLAQRAQSEGAG